MRTSRAMAKSTLMWDTGPLSPICGRSMRTGNEKNWWTRRCGGREVLILALPLVISTGSWTVMNFVDRMFLLWSSTDAMAAAMPAGILSFTVLCFPLGLAMYVNTFVAQYHGADRPQRIGAAVWQGVRIGLFAMPLFLATIPLAPLIFDAAGHDPEVVRLESIYYRVLCVGASAQVIAAAMSSFFTGRGRTRVVMTVDVLASLLNVVLDYVWIFGHCGFAEMGIEGAAWATVVSQWFRVLLYWRLMMRPEHRERYQMVAGRRFDSKLMRRMLRHGGPAARAAHTQGLPGLEPDPGGGQPRYSECPSNNKDRIPITRYN